jgi:tRNA pseudouridine38-40 synthase
MTTEDISVPNEAALVGPLHRVVLGCSYDGTDFHGFAHQPGQATIAGCLLSCLEKVAGEPVVLTTAARTDAGVHARTQVVHVDLPEAVISRFAEPRREGSVFGPELPGLAKSLRNQLPSTIGVFRAAVAPDGFDARFGATARRYQYDLVTSTRMDPARRATSWMVGQPLDFAAMRLASDPFVGEHDFAAFARRPPGGEGPIVRRVIETRWEQVEPDRYRFEIEAKAFAHQMVRSIVGTLVAVGQGRLRTSDVVAFLRRGQRSGLPTLAPPGGLTLVAVEYPRALGGRWV